jgi:hypothetical protein
MVEKEMPTWTAAGIRWIGTLSLEALAAGAGSRERSSLVQSADGLSSEMKSSSQLDFGRKPHGFEAVA